MNLVEKIAPATHAIIVQDKPEWKNKNKKNLRYMYNFPTEMQSVAEYFEISNIVIITWVCQRDSA